MNLKNKQTRYVGDDTVITLSNHIEKIRAFWRKNSAQKGERRLQIKKNNNQKNEKMIFKVRIEPAATCGVSQLQT